MGRLNRKTSLIWACAPQETHELQGLQGSVQNRHRAKRTAVHRLERRLLGLKLALQGNEHQEGEQNMVREL